MNERRWANVVHQLRSNASPDPYLDFNELNDKKKKARNNGPLSINNVLHQFCNDTSTHGPGQIYRVQSVIGRAIWGVIFIGALIAVVVQLAALAEKYRQWPTLEMTSLEHVPVSFPDVTVCSSRKVSTTNLAQMMTNPASMTYKYQKKLNQWRSTIQDQWFQLRSRSTLGMYENIGTHETALIGNSLKDFMVQCGTRGTICTQDQLQSFINPYFYNCYTFKGASASSDQIVPGPAYGLAMILYLETCNGTFDGHSLNSFSTLGNTVGVRVIIHPPGTMPLPYTHGFDIMPGHSTSIVLNVQHVLRRDEPYGKCTRNESLRDLDKFRYSLPACHEICMQHNCQSVCGCQSSYHPLPAENKEEMPYCGSLDQTPEQYINSTQCENRAFSNFNNDSARRDACNCPVQCDSFIYNPVITESYWPDPSAYLNFFDDSIVARPDHDSLTSYRELNQVLHDDRIPSRDRLDIVRLNFARLSVYFRDLDILTRQQIPSYGLNDLFSDFGGSMGLWVGISVLSIIECIQFIFTLFIVAWIRLKESRLVQKFRVQVTPTRQTTGRRQANMQKENISSSTNVTDLLDTKKTTCISDGKKTETSLKADAGI